MPYSRKPTRSTSWQKVSKWYNQKQGLKGSYYYEKVILPNSLRLLNLDTTQTLLDLGCGQGVLERAINKEAGYVGVDIAKDLVAYGNSHSQTKQHEFHVGDITRPLPFLSKRQFTRIAVILALQNLENLAGLFGNLHQHLAPSGRVVVVINHPYFRIPRQTSWEIDPQNKQQYRRVNRYQTSFKIPIEMNPGQRGSSRTVTWSFHYPLGMISEKASQAGLEMVKVEEWTSDKESLGKAAKMENFSRSEFPLFMALVFKQKKA